MIYARTGVELEEGPGRLNWQRHPRGREMTGATEIRRCARGRQCWEGDRFENQGDRLIARAARRAISVG